MEMTLRALNMLLWILIWTSGVLVSNPTPYENLFDDRLYADANRFMAQGLLFLLVMVGCDLILIWISRKMRGERRNGGIDGAGASGMSSSRNLTEA